jgi:hypothetical protein
MRKLTAIIKSIFAVHEAEPTQQTPEPTTEVTPRPERNETKTFGGVTYTVAELHDFRCSHFFTIISREIRWNVG